MELKFSRGRFNAGEMPARTRDGRKVLHVHDSGLDVNRPIVAWIGGGECWSYLKDGRIHHDRESDFDLVHEPQKVRVGLRRNDRTASGFLPTANPEYIDRWREQGVLVAEVEVEVGEEA